MAFLFAPIRQFRQFDHETADQPRLFEDDSEKGFETNGMEVRDGELVVTSLNGSPGADPITWSHPRKAFVMGCITLVALQTSYASAISSSNITAMKEVFGTTAVTGELSTAVFLWGSAVGALLVAPLSESIGRQPVYIVTLLVHSAFQLGSGGCRNFGSLLVCRFFAGAFGAAPLAVAGGSLNDMYEPVHLSYACPIYSGASFLGPMVAPMIGNSIASFWDWRWNYYLNGIIGCCIAVTLACVCPETLAEVLIYERAKRYWKATQTSGSGASSPESAYPMAKPSRKGISADAFVKTVLLKALTMLAVEPLLLFLTLYLSVVYFVFFAALEACSVIYTDLHGLSAWQTGLTFISVNIGIVFGTLGSIPLARRYQNRARRQGGKTPPPEDRLVTLLYGGFFLPIGLFWLGWTSMSSISIWASIPSGIFLGIATITIFIGTVQTLIDVYKENASSALAAVSLVRYTVSGGAVLAARPMFEVMKPHWACTLLGIVSALVIPVSFWFYYKGDKIRQRSKFAPSA